MKVGMHGTHEKRLPQPVTETRLASHHLLNASQEQAVCPSAVDLSGLRRLGGVPPFRDINARVASGQAMKMSEARRLVAHVKSCQQNGTGQYRQNDEGSIKSDIL
jgi:hypothetical protein